MEWYEIPVDTLRTMSDDILELSHFGLSSDYAYISKGYKHLKDREKTIGLYKRAVRKLQAEKEGSLNSRIYHIKYR